jgi:type IV secretion system protein VirB8
VSFLSPASGRRDVVQVRFLTARQQGGQGTEQVTHYVATLQYAYGTPSKNDRLRAANPLGFKVLEYRKEPEVLRTADDTRTLQ